MTHPPQTHPKLQAQARIATPMGELTAAATHDGLAGLWFDDQSHHPGLLGVPVDPEQRWLAAAARALTAYFEGAADPLQGLSLDLHGTDFQRAVWLALQALPRGSTASYGEIAIAAGRPSAVRATGAAIGRNPVSILVPCHRVIGSNGSLTGYAGGLHRKEALLQREGVLLL